MDINQSIMMAECAVNEHQERLQRANARWYLHERAASGPTVREALAGSLIALALWLAPQHAALGVQRG